MTREIPHELLGRAQHLSGGPSTCLGKRRQWRSRGLPEADFTVGKLYTVGKPYIGKP